MEKITKHSKFMEEVCKYNYDGHDFSLWWFIRFGIDDELKKDFKVKRIRNFWVESFFDFFSFLFTKLFKSNKRKKESCVIAQDRQFKDGKDEFFDEVTKHFEIEYMRLYYFSEPNLKTLKTFIKKKKMFEDYHTFEEYWSLRAFFQSLKAKRHFKKVWKEKEQEIKKKINHPIIKYSFENVFPRIIKYLVMAGKMVKKKNIKKFLLINEYANWERSLNLVSDIKKLKTIAVQHGAIHKEHLGYKYTEEELWKCETPPITPDVLCVYSKADKKEVSFDDGGECFSDVVVTGQPRYDKIVFGTRYDKKWFCYENALDRNKKIVLVLTHPFTKSEKIMQMVKDISESMPENCQIVVKPHPNESDYEKYYKIIPIGGRLLKPTDNTYEAINACDLVVTLSSTTSLECLFFNKPVLILPYIYSAPLLWDKYLIKIKKKGDIKKIIEKTLQNKYDFAQVKKEYLVDGNSGRRVFEQI